MAQPTLEDISVDFSHFSPDGDGVQDVVRYRFTLGGVADSADVHVEVQTGTETAPTGAVVVVLRDGRQAAGADTAAWDGRSTSGILQPDGYYWFLAQAATDTDTTTAVPVRVYLDTVAPDVVVVNVLNPYTPDIPGADSLARITVDLSGVGDGDQLEIIFRGPKPGSASASHFENLTSDGILVAGWNGRGSADGMYGVTARVTDAAGHANTAVGSDLNLDIAPPQGVITTPASPDTNGYIRFVAGEVTDRSGFQSVIITVFDATESSRAVVDSLPCPCTEEKLPFSVVVPDSVAETDSLIVELLLVDLPGHIGGSSTLFLVDTIPPPPPIFDPLPASVSRPQLEYDGTTTDADSVYIFMNGVIVNAHLVRNDLFSGTVTLGQGNNTLQGRAHDSAHNASGFSPGSLVVYDPTAGIIVPERFLQGDVIQVNLDSPADAVTINIYTLRGRKIRTFEDKTSNTFYDFPWDLSDDEGNAVGSGPYMFRIVIEMGDGSTIEDRVIAVVTR
jgi:flagellar hook assembly protein FlgD